MTEKTTDNGVIEIKGSAHTDQAVASGTQDQDKSEDTVAYDTYRRTLGEAKKYKSESAELKAKLEQYEQQKLEAEGRKDEVIEKLRKELTDERTARQREKATFAESQIRNQVQAAAVKMGCVDTDALTRLMDFDGLDVVDGYKVSNQSLEMVLNKAKTDKPYLFSKPAPNIQDGVPVTSEYNGKVDLSKMSTDQIISMARKGIKK